MACFLVPTAEAIVVSAISARVKSTEEARNAAQAGKDVWTCEQITWSRKLSWLKSMLWGGSLLLLLEHMWHGEVVPWPPFLTAMLNSADTAEMLAEMATVGVLMALLVTVVWLAMVAAVTYLPAARRIVLGEEA